MFTAGFNGLPNPSAQRFAQIEVLGGSKSLDMWELLAGTNAKDLVGFKTSLPGSKEDSLILAYGQNENFDSKSQLSNVPGVSKRLVLISEWSGDNQILMAQEAKMPEWFGVLFGFDKTKNKSLFSETIYKGIKVRFKNFPYPDHSIDYAVISFDGKDYITFSSSRQSMFSAIDAFMVSGK
ncbi:MAG: hypothetical protein UX77_C0010G0002 [Parcubacteria group bacterium GW2011_GWA1_47_11]|uniref:Uncharacterized protein n=1 Tax=Candidatus Yanofskybacteria bacterium RIFCSPHIGHO2_01_FULL_48_25b TaxID=1802672 RepID=A0A1F8EZV1_9BACT|nr:MAG: hypothetical protein UX77_C0010G0002 [Parcubacteria group bacterium GW2011_GWA1_47_11]OGN06407.1 MAG: hypothetical protein A2669_01420 [Candidatus Yanofskybacteria bacterium RIFCSPHIGHO2_01_FULL_48_25b]